MKANRAHAKVRSESPTPVPLIVAAEGCYNGGMSAQECAQFLYNNYSNTSAGQLATTILSIWTTVSASDLTAILTGLNVYTQDEIQVAVTNAYAYYLDVMVRDTLIDQGQIPYPYNDVYQSPDIYPVGTQPLSNPNSLLNTWNQGPSANIYWNSSGTLVNYIYIRATNLFPGATPWYAPSNGQTVPDQIYLHYSLASLLLKPSQWEYNLIPTGPNQPIIQPATVSATQTGQQMIGSAAFQWTTSPPPSGDHYCLIARVVTYGHPNPIPPDGSLTSFCNYVRDNPCVAWRNVSIVYTGSSGSKAKLRGEGNGVTDDTSPMVADLVIVNPETATQGYVVQVVANNMPNGTTIELTSSDTDLNLGPVTVNQSSQNWFVTASLDASYTGTLQVTITLPSGATLAGGAEVSVINFAQAQQGTELHAYGKSPESYGMSAQALGLQDGDAVVFVGNFDFQFNAGTDPYQPPEDDD